MAKDPFKDLDQDFKDTILNAQEEDIRKKIAEVALNQASVIEAKAADKDLDEKRVVYKDAGEMYREATKMNKARILFCKQVLGDAGKANGSFEQD